MFAFSAPPVLAFAALSLIAPTDDWMQFLGSDSRGTARGDFVFEWGPEKNLIWKTDLPGRGSSSPILVGNRVFVTCYSGYGIGPADAGDPKDLKRHLLCLERTSGKVLWERIVDSQHDEDPYTGYITEHGYASSTPVSDGRRVFAFFGKSGIHAFDLDGNPLWSTRLGTESDPARWGEGSSPVLYRGLVIVNASNVARSIVGIDQATGKTVWTNRDESFRNTWATPKLVSHEGRDELVIPVPGKLHSLDPLTGRSLWFVESPMVDSIYQTVVEENGVVMTMGGRNQRAIAVRCGGRGDVTQTHLLWNTRLQSGIGTPVVAGGRLYWASQGKGLCASCETGKPVASCELPGSLKGHRFDYPSPIAVGDRLLVLFRNGNASILDISGDPVHLHDNGLGEEDCRCNATPAFSNGQLFIRSDRKLYAFRLPEARKPVR